jgi:hypothetical protein
MSNIQGGYGHGDVFGIPFDFYAGAVGVPTGATYTMQTNQLVLFPAAAVTGVTVNLPLNPVDGCCAEISNVGLTTSTVTGTIAPNTGDAIAVGGLGIVTVITPAALTTAGSASNTIKYKYSLNGFQPASGAAVNPRTWFRVQ